jgi:hypothetical protein
MAIALNHTIVPARDKETAARQFAQLFGLAYERVGEQFAPVKVNDTLSFLFDDDAHFERHHYAFHVSEAEFDAIFRRVQEAALATSPIRARRDLRRVPQRSVRGRHNDLADWP